MKSTPTLRLSFRRLSILTLVSLIAVAALLGVAASANKANREAKALQARETRAAQATQAGGSKSVSIKNSSGQQGPSAPNATVITATLDDNVAAATKVAPGGTINYTAVIKNTGTAGTDDATSVNYSHILDSNTTLVPGSVHASPIAFNNSYTTAIGNTLLEVSNSPSSTAPKVTAPGTLFDNDTIATAPDTFVLQSFQTPSANGGTVAVNANGSFTYLPAAGFTGTDTFTYTIRNSADATLQDTATVTITVNTPRVWYVDNSGANGDGRSTSPFNTLAGAAAVDGIGDIIYIFTGGGNYTGGITLLNNEQVIGNGVALVVNTITLRAAGARPTVVNGAGNGITLASGNTLNGFNFGNCTGGFAFQGGGVGTLTVNNMAITTNGGAMDITAALSSVSINLDSTTSSGGAQNVRLVTVNGTVTLAGGALSGATGNGLDVSGGAPTITFSGPISNSGAKQVNAANMTGGSIALTGAVGGTGTGINLATNTGALFTFSGGVVLSTAGNTAFNATGGGTVNVCDENPCAAGATGALINTLTTTTGTALNVTSTNIGSNNLEFRSINSPTASANSGIVLSTTGSAGGLKIVGTGGAGTGGTISNKSVTGVSLTSTAKVILTSMNITANGDQIDENGIRAIDMTGTSSFTNLSVTGSFHANAWVANTTGTLALTVTGSSFTTSQTHDGFHNASDGNSNVTITVTNCNFNSNFSDGFDGGIASNTATSISDISLTTSSYNTNGANGILIYTAGSGDSHFNIFSNTSISGNPSNGVNLFQNNGTLAGGKLRGKLNGNTITETTVNGGGTCAILNAQGLGTATVEITSNICNYNRGSNTGIVIQSGDGGPGSTIVKFTGNTINMAGIDLPLGAINIESGLTAASTRTLCLNAGVVGAADDDIVNLDANAIANGVFKLRLRKRPNSFFNIQGITPNPSTTLAQVQNYVSSVMGVPAADILVSGPATYQINYTDATCSTAASIPNWDNAVNQRAEPRATTATPALRTNSQLQSQAAVVSSQAPAIAASVQPSSNKSSAVLSHHAVRNNSRPSADSPDAPLVTVSVALGTLPALPAGKTVTIKYAVTVNTPPLARQISAQGTVTFNGNPGGSVNTTDFSPPNGPFTVTLIDTLVTWNGSVDTNWNTANNWTVPGGTSYAPGVTNPAVNDVVIPNVGAQPNIPVGGGDIGLYSMSIANGRTLTIDTGRTLTIGGSPGGDLTVDGIISGGFLNLGTGTHVINNAGGTGSLSSTNVATVLSGSTVTLNNNLQAGALAVNAGGSMTIATRTLSLNGSGATLVIPGGATFTTTGSTVVFNGTAAQQAAGIAYNNLTINNTLGLNVTGVTLTGNATLNGALVLTSSDLNTSTFSLTQANTTASTGVSDVVGTVIRTGGPFPLGPLTFGNPNNIITFTGAGTRPTTMTVVMAKTAPATYLTAVTRNYTISQTGGSLFTATVRLHYLDSELNGNLPETSLGLRRLRNPGDQHWVAAPPPPGVPTRDGAANWIEATGVLAVDLTTQWTFSTQVPTATGGVVTGRIVDQSGAPVEGAVVRLSGTQNRKFITDANGVYRFDNVETTGFYTVTPSRANYTFNPASRSFSQLGETTEAAFGATLSSSGFVNPLDTPEYFVRQHYIDFLGREPDEAGFNFWSDQILSCGGDQMCISRKRENVSAAYFLSIEFQKTGGLVDGLYRASYGVRPDFAQFMPDTRTVGLGVQVGQEGWETTLNANKEAFINAFVNRAAFHQVYDNMDNSLFVDTLIGHTGVSFTAGERDALVSGLGTGTMTRAEALRSIAENNRFADAKFNDAFVMMEYFGYLRRNPDAGGFAFWLDKLNQFGGNFEQAEMVKAFIVSGEYRDRFPR